jgi:hypothetical protein
LLSAQEKFFQNDIMSPTIVVVMNMTKRIIWCVCFMFPSGQLAVIMLQNRIMEVSGTGKLERQILCYKAGTFIGTD